MRPIDADALMTDLDQTIRVSAREENSAKMRGIRKVLDRIKAAPTISPDDVRGVGEWMLLADQNPEDVKAGNYAYWCSRCYAGDVHAKTQEVPYCWKCGARMKGAEDGTTYAE